MIESEMSYWTGLMPLQATSSHSASFTETCRLETKEPPVLSVLILPPHPETSQFMAGKGTKGLPPPEVAIVETFVCEGFDDGWGSYSDPDFTTH